MQGIYRSMVALDMASAVSIVTPQNDPMGLQPLYKAKLEQSRSQGSISRGRAPIDQLFSGLYEDANLPAANLAQIGLAGACLVLGVQRVANHGEIRWS